MSTYQKTVIAQGGAGIDTPEWRAVEEAGSTGRGLCDGDDMLKEHDSSVCTCSADREEPGLDGQYAWGHACEENDCDSSRTATASTTGVNNMVQEYDDGSVNTGSGSPPPSRNHVRSGSALSKSSKGSLTGKPRLHRQKALVPVRVVAVLVDGAGKGWMAARRLWSVQEVGFDALSKAGLTSGDVDQDQEVGCDTRNNNCACLPGGRRLQMAYVVYRYLQDASVNDCAR